MDAFPFPISLLLDVLVTSMVSASGPTSNSALHRSLFRSSMPNTFNWSPLRNLAETEHRKEKKLIPLVSNTCWVRFVAALFRPPDAAGKCSTGKVLNWARQLADLAGGHGEESPSDILD